MRLMRILVMFDLPTKTAPEKKRYARFRKFLLKDGYSMMQFSVYTRIVRGLDGVETHRRRLKASLPPKGHIRMMTITERQFADIELLLGHRSTQEEIVGPQLQLLL